MKGSVLIGRKKWRTKSVCLPSQGWQWSKGKALNWVLIGRVFCFISQSSHCADLQPHPLSGPGCPWGRRSVSNGLIMWGLLCWWRQECRDHSLIQTGALWREWRRWRSCWVMQEENDFLTHEDSDKISRPGNLLKCNVWADSNWNYWREIRIIQQRVDEQAFLLILSSIRAHQHLNRNSFRGWCSTISS